MPGYRSGFVAGDPELIALLKRYRPNVGVAPQAFVQRAAAAAWRDEAHVEHVRAGYRAKRDVLLPVLEARGLRNAGGDATFFLWLDAGPGAELLADRLLRRGDRARARLVLRPGRHRLSAAGARPHARRLRTRRRAARPPPALRSRGTVPLQVRCARGQSVWVIGHSDQIARTSVRRAIQPSSASVRPASPTMAIAASRSPVLIAQATAALPNSRHS